MCRHQCPWGGPRAVAAARGVVGPATGPPRPLPDPLRVGGEATKNAITELSITETAEATVRDLDRLIRINQALIKCSISFAKRLRATCNRRLIVPTGASK